MVCPSARIARAGFTLVELAVVLAIVGILAGAVLVGQHFVRQSEVQVMSTNLSRYVAGYKQFETQYGGVPGDIVDATDYWGADPNGCPTNNVQTPRKETCNGNGNRQVAETNTYAVVNECYRFWQQLADAGYIPGLFSGVSASATNAWASAPNVNEPAGPMPNSFYGVQWIPNMTDGTSAFYNGNYGNVIEYGLSTGGGGYPLLSAKDMYAIDLKLDDGLPGTGAVRALVPLAMPNCATGTATTPTTAVYNLTSASTTTLACALIYVFNN